MTAADVTLTRGRIRSIGTGALVIALSCLLGACSLLQSMLPSIAPPGAGAVGVEVSNATTLPITIVVNGVVARNVGPGDDVREPMTAAVLGPMPWNVVARTPSGRVLLSFTVNDGDVVYQDLGSGQSSARGVGGRVDLSCGRLDVWAGPPILGPAPGPGVPGDCAP